MKQTDLFAPAPATPGAAAPSPPASPTLSLHRMHAAPASGTGGSSFDLGAVRWRGEGGDTAWKRSVAHRLCLCWNLCEGWPTSTLEDGVLRELDDVSFRLEAALTDLLANDPCALPREIITLVETASALRAARDADYDDTDGRPHDCPDCLRKGL